MYRRLLQDSFLYSLSTIVSRGFSLITVPLFTKVLSPADYGALELLSYLVILIPLLTGLALDQAVGRFYQDAGEEEKKQVLASTVLFFNVFIGMPLLPLAVIFGGYIAGTFLNGAVDSGTIILLAVFIWVHSIYYIANNQLKYAFLSKQVALISIGCTVIGATLCIYFVVFQKMGVFGMFLGQLIAQGISAIVSIYIGRRFYTFSFSRKVLASLAIYSAPLVPSTLSFYMMQYADRYIINDICTLSDVGLYGIGARLASLVNLFLTGFQGAWVPIVMKKFREPSAAEYFRNVFNYYLFIAILILLGLSLFSREILLLLTTAEFSAAYVIVPLMVSTVILASIAGYFTYGIQIAKKSQFRMYLNLGGLLLNIILNYLLVPRFSIIGAALATALTFLVMSIIGMAVSQRLYFVPYNWLRISAAGAFVLCMSNLVLFLPTQITLWVIGYKLLIIAIAIIGSGLLLDISLGKLLRVRIKAW